MYQNQTGIVFSNGIGDAILTLPAIRALKESYPDAVIVTPPGPQFRVVFDEFRKDLRPMPFLSGQEFDAEHLTKALGDGVQLAAFFITWMNSALQRWLSETNGKVESYGFFSEFSCCIHSHEMHYFDRYIDITKALIGPRLMADYIYPHSCSEWHKFNDRLNAKLKMFGDFWVIHADTKSDKVFSRTFWSSLVKRLLESAPWIKLVIVGRDPENFIESAVAPNQLLFVPPHFALSTFLITRAKKFIGVDSCFLHYADLQGIASIGLFQSHSNINLWGLRITSNRVNAQADDEGRFSIQEIADLIIGLPCSGC